MGIEFTGKVHGVKSVMKTLRAAFPKNAEQQRRLLNQAMSGSARGSILPIAKALALIGDGSGALSESLAPRAVSKSRAMRKGAAASVQITPVRYNKKAMAMYSAFYFGRGTHVTRLAEGIRHGHLVEFGTKHSAAYPFLYPALKSGRAGYINIFAETLEKKIAAAVKRKAKKAVIR